MYLSFSHGVYPGVYLNVTYRIRWQVLPCKLLIDCNIKTNKHSIFSALIHSIVFHSNSMVLCMFPAVFPWITLHHLGRTARDLIRRQESPAMGNVNRSLLSRQLLGTQREKVIIKITVSKMFSKNRKYVSLNSGNIQCCQTVEK